MAVTMTVTVDMTMVTTMDTMTVTPTAGANWHQLAMSAWRRLRLTSR